ncbi:MAG TPA: hypothetical protein VHT02_01870 [Methylocella sp.]|nr:hypothetical protein [Methylocella sp.]
MSDQDSRNYAPIQEISIADRHYDLISRECANCGVEHYEIWRCSGVCFARYKMPASFTCDDFQQFVETLDEQLLEASHDILEEFHEEIDNVNSPEGIEADYSFSFRLLEYGRQRVIALRKLN